MVGQAQDQGKSKGSVVMAEISVEYTQTTLPTPKGGPLPMWSPIAVVMANLRTWERR